MAIDTMYYTHLHKPLQKLEILVDKLIRKQAQKKHLTNYSTCDKMKAERLIPGQGPLAKLQDFRMSLPVSESSDTCSPGKREDLFQIRDQCCPLINNIYLGDKHIRYTTQKILFI